MAITREQHNTTPSASRPGQMISVDDFRQRPGVELQLADTGLSPQSVMMRGHFHQQTLGQGLVLRYGDSREECAYTATSKLEAGLCCIIFLRGDIEIQVGKHRHRFSDDGIECDQQKLLTICSRSPQEIRRASRYPQQVRYLSIAATGHWMENRFGSDRFPADGNAGSALDFRAESLSPRQRLLVWEIIRLLSVTAPTGALLLESKVIELLAGTAVTTHLCACAAEASSLPSGVSRRELQSFLWAREIIRENTAEPLSVAQIARATGTSASGLQRTFRKLEGVSVMEFTRHQRMQRALEALQSGAVSVQHASALAGFRSAANFATAFRKMFGFSPRETLPRTGKRR